MAAQSGANSSAAAVWAPGLAAVEEFTTQVCLALGAPPEVAEEVASHLVGANRAGHDSHGVIRLTMYADAVERGELDPAATPEVTNEFGALALCDAHRGFGHFSTRFACELAAERACDLGVGFVAVRHSSHIGRLGHYLELLTRKGLVAIVTVGMAGPGVGAMVLPGTAQRFLGANPWAMGVPVAGGPPMIVDVSTAVVAEGKVQVALAEGRDVPPGCIVDSQGQPTTDPALYFAGGGLLPLGGLAAAHKGFGLGLAAALFGSLSMIGDSEPSLAGAPVAAGADPRGRVAGVVVMAIDPAPLGGRQAYEAMVAETIAAIRRVGGEQAHVQVPGEPEARSRSVNARTLSLPAATRQELQAIADRLGLSLPGSAV